jgi:hypothetical protein
MVQGPQRAEVWLHSSTANVYAIRTLLVLTSRFIVFIVWCSGSLFLDVAFVELILILLKSGYLRT